METTTPHPRIVADRLGGVAETARLLFCTTQAVYKWIRIGEMPKLVVAYLSVTRPDAVAPVRVSSAKRKSK